MSRDTDTKEWPTPSPQINGSLVVWQPWPLLPFVCTRTPFFYQGLAIGLGFGFGVHNN